ncbi:MAG: transporter substrate-binding domain-containing protein [SAR324 cluster bacterium]|nr:transporter substrate-binding domain-containing protein [SAR324 cluster bacterium]
MCVDPSWEPFEKIDKKGNHVGMVGDYIHLIKDLTGLKIKVYITKTWAESIDAAKARKCDFFSLVAKTPERESYMDFTEPYLELHNALVSTSDKAFVPDIQQILDKRIGVVKGFANAELLKQKYPSINLVEVKSSQEGLLKLVSGEIDYMNDFLASASFYIGKLALSDVKIVGTTDLTLGLGFATRDDEPLLNNILEKAVRAISREQKNQITAKWITVKYQQSVDYTVLFKWLAGAMVLLFFSLFWNQRLSKEVALRKKAESTALKERKRATLANEAKSEFLANMSHELRTPMNSVLGFTQLLEMNDLDSDSKSFVNSIKVSGNTLLHVINSILDLSQVEAGKMVLTLEPTGIRSILQEMEELFKLELQKKGLTLTIKISDHFPRWLLLDALRVRQILLNLISNAIKFTEIGEITVEIASKPSLSEGRVDLSLVVQDTGIGIKARDLNEIFSPFMQTHKNRSKYGGTGLGLSITQHLVKLFGGEIKVESFSGKGTKFFGSFPDILIATDPSLKDISTAITESQLASLKGRVLIVDDKHMNRSLITAMLACTELKLETAEDGAKAVEMALETIPDLILMDIKMPVMDGFEAASLLKKNKVTAKIPIVALTATILTDIEKKKLNCFDGTLQKPIVLNDLWRLILEQLS